MRNKIIDKIKRGSVYAIIPARSGSKGVPGKNVKLLDGYPLIAFSIATARLTPSIDRIIVTTDSVEYAQIARQFNADTPFLRPAEISNDSATDFEFMAHAINWLYDNGEEIPEYWVHLRPTCPLRETSDVERAVKLFKGNKDANSLRSAHRTNYMPYKWFRVKNGYFLPIIHNMTLDEANNPRHDFPITYEPDGYVDVLRTEFIVQNDLLHGTKMLALESPDSVDIDLKEDFEKLTHLIKSSDSPPYRYLKSKYTRMSLQNTLEKYGDFKNQFSHPIRILMIGLGSIGQRHLRNIKLLLGEKVEFIAYRKRGLSITFSNEMEIRENVNLEKEYKIKSFSKLDEALNTRPSIAFITNITSGHISTAIECAKTGCDLFIEKPLSYNMDGVNKLSDIVNENELIAFMGFQNRYHPCLKKIKKLLSGSQFGNIISINVAIGERLPTMHAYEDYRETYMAKSEYGGGVVLNQMIHELDYIRYILGENASVEHIYSVGGHISSLEIDVDDVAHVILSYCYNGRKIPVTIRADFLKYPPERYCEIICDTGSIRADLLNNAINWYIDDEMFSEVYGDFSRNDMFVEQLYDFFNATITRSTPKIDLNAGIESLKQALAIKSAIETSL
ncbi:MAG: Gfo/Idh/MocA family oxidoreductase [Clostridiales bacterium]|jgi:CMP-N-acetylneuraminic acid synthetase/predicted dehydrogenase|nr:Gfo/Idh/MocA family oxidoreductase [Clostridiales bacterium]